LRISKTMNKRFGKLKKSVEERVYLQAAKWVSRRDRGLEGEEEELEFLDWLAENPMHGEIYEEAKANWEGFDPLWEQRPVDDREPRADLLKPPVFRIPVKAWVLYPGAAAILVGLLALVFVWMGAGGARDMEFPAGGGLAASLEVHKLPDGSVIELNRGARAVARFSAESRRVNLHSGQAHFKVARDPGRPFVVQVKDLEVKAIGTAFTVEVSDSDLEVLVTEGRVRLERTPPPESSRGVPAPLHAKEGLELSAGQGAVQKIASEISFVPEVRRLSPGEIKSKLSWRETVLQFEAAPLYQVLAEVNRHNRTEIIIRDDELREVRITATLQPDNLEGLLTVLKIIAGIQHYQTDDGNIVLYKSGDL